VIQWPTGVIQPAAGVCNPVSEKLLNSLRVMVKWSPFLLLALRDLEL
jgi:hypothetical protein